MRHGAHKAAKENPCIQVAQLLFSPTRGSHSTRAVRAVQFAANDGAILGIDQALADKLNEIAPQTRRAMREAARAAERRSNIIVSTSLAALVGTAATSLALANPESPISLAADPATTTTQLKRVTPTSSVSRSTDRTPLSSVTDNAASAAESSDASDGTTTSANGRSQQTSNEGDWQISDDGASLDVSNMSRSTASNPQVASRMDSDYDLLPDGFNPNHATGENGGNAYPWGQCTWYAFERRVELGLPVGSYFGNGADWADSATTFGYWVDSTARHQGDVVVFQPGQLDADAYYGHVAIVEKIHKDGSIEVSESNVKGLGVISHRTISASDAAKLQYIHY
ncbi:CHAP domain-containing protein [Bifidobacterium amazonense]|uniref:CHAP domain-containing protein n=1 Tax=Bifidobacterium amazonense TaxID=2809027 RepID=A0ABS9VYE7_9BIFI|nr:CHAP domain-containing protein [Bifidobacterium amazonense]MCH9276941.1 CHAP domain-containing protein [Bifidobacterium amazonense]